MTFIDIFQGLNGITFAEFGPVTPLATPCSTQ